jgi:asparagine synthase (glutamine-hydrolysing)
VARELLAQDGKSRLHTFSAIFDDVPECDERPFINAVLAQGSLEAHYVRGDQLSPLADLDRVFHHEDEAFYAPNLFMHWALYRAAQSQGVRILLDGIDGDTTVSHSLVYLAELVRAGRWKSLTEEVNGLSRRFNGSRWRFLWRYGLSPLAPEPVRRAWRRLRGRNRSAWTVNSTTNPDFARRIGLAERAQALLGKHSRPARTSREDHWRRLTSGMIPFALEVADRAAAAFSLEPRYPFFDKRLVEFCLALPPGQKLYQGWTRMVMRRAMANVLPDEVRWRGGKSNLSPGFARGLLAFDRGLLEEVILNDARAIEEYVDIAALRKAYHRFVSRFSEDDSLTVWRSVTLALWLHRTGVPAQVNLSQHKL